MKTCSQCKTLKPISEFYKRSETKNGRQSYCKECAKKHYKGWSDQSPERKRRHAEWKKARILAVRAKYLDYMSDKACIDCGDNRFVVLQHDHVRGDKVAGVAALIRRGHSWEVVLDEISKCEVRCANCHTIKTAHQFNWWTAAL